MIVSKIFLALLIFGVSLCDSYRILAIFPYNGKSHSYVYLPVAKALANKGHQVDVISHFPLKKPVPNYTDIVKLPPNDHPQFIYHGAVNDIDKERTWLNKKKAIMCDYLGLPEISNLIKNPPADPPYDLLLVHMLSNYQCITSIGYYWNIPVAVVTTTIAYPQLKNSIGDPLNLAFYASHLKYYKEKMTFWDKVCNVIKTHHLLYKYYQYADMQDYYIKKYFNNTLPHYRELETKLSILFSNSHYSFHGVQPKTTAHIEIGGIHINNDDSILDSNLKKYLDGSKDGFIYFSFGSNVAIESLPIEVLNRFYAVLRKASPIKIIMRAPRPESMPKNLPDNVFIQTWLPQQHILQHPNIKAFVSHGGGLGTQEAVYYKVPMICVPLFYEQNANCDILSFKNASIKIDIHTALQKDYDNAFQKILTDPLYKESMKKLSDLYRDRSQSPKDAVTYWIEYVIRHGKNVLRSPSADLKWWQLDLLDVYIFIFTCAIIILLTFIFILKLAWESFVRKLYSEKTVINKKLN